MKRFTALTLASILAVSTAGIMANAESHVTKTEGMELMMGDEGAEMLMKSNGATTKLLAEMSKGTVAYDAAAAEAAKQTLIMNAQNIPAVFKEPFTEGEALPAIWENFEDFTAKAKAYEDAATALDVSSPEAIATGLGPIGGACGACHQAYRAKS